MCLWAEPFCPNRFCADPGRVECSPLVAWLAPPLVVSPVDRLRCLVRPACLPVFVSLFFSRVPNGSERLVKLGRRRTAGGRQHPAGIGSALEAAPGVYGN